MENRQTCAALMQNLSEAHFYALDLNLYLDTHPNDENALAMFREACRQYECCKEAFEEHCWPLTACSAGDSDDGWTWLCGAWPSERMV